MWSQNSFTYDWCHLILIYKIAGLHQLHLLVGIYFAISYSFFFHFENLLLQIFNHTFSFTQYNFLHLFYLLKLLHLIFDYELIFHLLFYVFFFFGFYCDLVVNFFGNHSL